MKRPKNQTIKKEEEDGVSEDNHCLEPKKKSFVKSEDYLKCELCDTLCSSVSQLQAHTLAEHVPVRKVQPSSRPSHAFLQPSCSSSSSNNSNPSSAPPMQQKVSCQQCEDTFDNFAQFAIHMKTHIGNANMVYYCPICPVAMPFRDKKSQLEHITSQHVQMQMVQQVCEECETVFSTAPLLAQHFWQVHSKHKFYCSGSSCDFVCESEKTFKEHSKSHCRQMIMYGCTLCATAFQNQHELMAHVQISHDQDTFFPPNLFVRSHGAPSPKAPKPRPLQCSVCDETVFGEDGLDEHRLERHCKVRYADKCADCHESIATENSFVEHCLRHAKDHAHHCPVCRQSLRSESQIHAHCAYHMKKSGDDSEGGKVEKIEGKKEVEEEEADISMDDYSFVCPICGEKTDDGFALIEHSKNHL